VKCKNIREKLYFYHYGLLNASQTGKVENHLLECKTCRKELDLIRNRTELFNAGDKEVKVESYLDKKILSRAGEILREKQPGFVFKSYKPLILKLGLASVFVFIMGILIFRQMNMNNSAGSIVLTRHVIINDQEVRGRMHLKKEAGITVPEGSSADIELKGSYKIHLYEKTDFFISKSRDVDTYINMNSGSVYFSVNRRKEEMKIETLNSLIRITGTKFRVSVNKEENSTKIEMVKGSIVVQNKFKPEKSVVALAGEKVIVSNRDLPLIIRSEMIEDPFKEGAAPAGKYKERVYLKTGSVFTGNIITQDGDEIIIDTDAGEIKLNNIDIDRIEYIK